MRFDVQSESDLPQVEERAQTKPNGKTPDDPQTDRKQENGKASDPGKAHMRVEDVMPFASYQHKTPAWIVDGLIPAGAVILMWGATGSGKSTFWHALAQAVADGEPFVGRETRQRDVLILDRENSEISLQLEFERIGFKDGPRLKYWGTWCKDPAPALGSAVVLEWVKAHPDCLVIVDSYVAFYGGESENDAVQTRRFIGEGRTIANAGGTVVYLHHPGKDHEKGPRGSSDIGPAIDTAFSFSNYDTSGQSLLDRITIKTSIKTRFTPLDLNVRYVAGNFVVDQAARSKTVTERLAELLRDHPGVSGQEFETLSHNAGLGRNRGRDFLKAGVKNGTVRCEKVGIRKSHFLVSPPDVFNNTSRRDDFDRRDENEYEQ